MTRDDGHRRGGLAPADRYGSRANLKEFFPEGVVSELKRLHYATANSTGALAMAALLKLVPTSQITYGTDYRYFPLGQIASLRQMADRELAADKSQSRIETMAPGAEARS